MILVILILYASGLEINTLSDRISNGKLHYEVYTTSGSCWEKAVQSMISTCSEMDEFTQSLFAAKLTNCHLKRLGLKEITCPIGPGCELDSNSYIAYTQFFTHSFDICVYVSYTAWQTRTQNTIQALSLASETSLKALETSHSLAQQIYDKQEDVKAQIARSIELHKELQLGVEKTKEEMQGFAAEFMNSSKRFQEEMNKQQEVLGKWLSKIYNGILEIGYMQETLLGELWDINSILFCCFFTVFFLFFTSFPETSFARPRIFSLFLLELFSERFLPPYSKSNRTLLLLLCGFILFFSIRRYKQYDRLSYDLLRDFILKVGNKALVALTPNPTQIKSLPSPLKEQCLSRLKKIRELPPELEQDHCRVRRNPTDPGLASVFRALSEKKPRTSISVGLS